MKNKFVNKIIAIKGIGSGVTLGKCLDMEGPNVLLDKDACFMRDWKYATAHGAMHSLASADITGGEITAIKNECLITDAANVVLCDDNTLEVAHQFSKGTRGKGKSEYRSTGNFREDIENLFTGKIVATKGIGSGVTLGKCAGVLGINLLFEEKSLFMRKWDYSTAYGAMHSLSAADITGGEITIIKNECFILDVAIVVLCDSNAYTKALKYAK